MADCFVVPQIRKAPLRGINLIEEFPLISKVFNNLLNTPSVAQVVNDAGGTVQPLAFDADKFEVYQSKFKK